MHSIQCCSDCGSRLGKLGARHGDPSGYLEIDQRKSRDHLIQEVGWRRQYRRYGYPVPYAYYPPAYGYYAPPPAYAYYPPAYDSYVPPPAVADGDYSSADGDYGDYPPANGEYGEYPPADAY